MSIGDPSYVCAGDELVSEQDCGPAWHYSDLLRVHRLGRWRWQRDVKNTAPVTESRRHRRYDLVPTAMHAHSEIHSKGDPARPSEVDNFDFLFVDGTPQKPPSTGRIHIECTSMVLQF